MFWRALAVSVMVLGAVASTAVARTTNFDANWRFALVNREAATEPTGAYEHAADPGYDDSSWRQLDLPHDWSIELLPTPTGGTTAGGGWIAGLDNGREEDPEGFKGTAHTAFNGKALAIVRGGRGVTASAPGLRSGSTTLAPSVDRFGPARPPAQPTRRFETPAADASYSGAQDTIPAAMLDGDMSTGWSNLYVADATALLPEISRAHAREWVSLASPAARRRDRLTASFTIDEHHALPAAIQVSYWDGHQYVPVQGQHVDWAGGSNQPSTITFDPISTTKLKLEMTSAAPGTHRGFLRIVELR